MLERLGGFFKKGSQETLVLEYTDVPAWLDGNEEQLSSYLAEDTANHVAQTVRIIERLRQNLVRLQEEENAGGNGSPAGETTRAPLAAFIRETGEPLLADLPQDTCRFFAVAETVFNTCNEALIEHGPVLREDFPDEIAALKEDTHALGLALLGARAPIIEKCRAKKKLIKGAKDVLAQISEVEQDSDGSSDRMSWIQEQVLEISGDLERLGADRANLESDPGPLLKMQQEEYDRLAAEREKIRQSFFTRADIASALMAWARSIAHEKNDPYADDVLFELIQLLSGGSVPDADHLMSALVCAFPIILDMLDSGELVPGDDEAASVLKSPAEFNNELCRICRDFAAVNERIQKIPVGSDALAQKIRQIEDEEERLRTQIRELETAGEDLNTRLTLAALRRQNLKKPLEESLSLLSGSPVKVRMNGQGLQGSGAGRPADPDA